MPIKAPAVLSPGFHFAVCDANGKLRRWGHCALKSDALLQASVADDVVIMHNLAGQISDATHYVDQMQRLVSRPALPPFPLDKLTIAADGVDTATISTLPNPTTVTVHGPNGNAQYQVTDGVFQFSAEIMGAYFILCDAFPSAPQLFTITAT
jgi:hypothetical protein